MNTFKEISPILTEIRQKQLDRMAREKAAYRAYNEARVFFRNEENSESACKMALGQFAENYSDFATLNRQLSEGFDHAMQLRPFPEFDETTGRIVFGDVTLFHEQGSNEVVESAPNRTVYRVTIYTDAKTAQKYEVVGIAYELGARAYNHVYLNGDCVSANNYSLSPNHGAWAESSLAALRMGMNTGENHVLKLTGALPI